VYLDTDLECLRPLDDVLEGQQFVGVCHKPGRITNTAIAAVPGHPLLERALEEVRPMDMYWTNASERLKEVAGPLLLDRLVPEYPDVKLLEPGMFFPSTPAEREHAIAVHHMARVWHNTTTLRAAMLRAEKRLEQTKAKLAAEERRHEATRERLAKLEGRRKERRPDKEGKPSKKDAAPPPRADKPARAEQGDEREKQGSWLRRRV
jgi:hypothetical protein